jgi:hypothetical protein
MSDTLLITTLVTSLVTAFVVFVKQIRKCKCGNCLEIERSNDEMTRDQENQVMQTMLTIFKTNFTPRRTETNQEQDVENPRLSRSGRKKPIYNLIPKTTKKSSRTNTIGCDITPDQTLGEVAKRLGLEPRTPIIQHKNPNHFEMRDIPSSSKQSAPTTANIKKIPAIDTSLMHHNQNVSEKDQPQERQSQEPSITISDSDQDQKKFTNFIVKK